jgi:hypothetical protein
MLLPYTLRINRPSNAKMTWKPTTYIDDEIRRWMKAKGWEVNCRPECDREVYAWRHEVPGRPSYAVRISQKVLEDYPPFAVAELLDRLNVAAAMRARPDARYIVTQNGARVTLEEASGE